MLHRFLATAVPQGVPLPPGGGTTAGAAGTTAGFKELIPAVLLGHYRRGTVGIPEAPNLLAVGPAVLPPQGVLLGHCSSSAPEGAVQPLHPAVLPPGEF